MFRLILATGLLSSFIISRGQLVYGVQELRYPGALGSWSSAAFAVNDSGVVGGAAVQPDGRYLPRLWFPAGSTLGLSMPDGTPSGAINDITEAGVAVGEYRTPLNQQRGFRFADGMVTDIGVLPGFEVATGVKSVNNSGVICGLGHQTGGVFHAFTNTGGAFIDLHDFALGCTRSAAYGINDAGSVVGGGRFNSKDRAVAWWSDGTFEVLPSLPGVTISDCAFAVNMFGEVTGQSYVDALGDRPPIWRQGHPPVDLGVPAGQDSAIGTAINDLGQVIGYADERSPNTPTTSFLASESLGNFDLRFLAGGMPGWREFRAFAINNKGLIVGQGIYEYSLGQTRWTAFKLTPVSSVAVPLTYTVQLGKYQSGKVQSLATLDADALRVCRFLVPNSTVAPVTVQLDGTLPFLPMNLWLSTFTKMDSAGSFSLTVDMWDWRASQFDVQDSATGVVSTQYVMLESIAKGDIRRYVGEGNAVRARLRVKPTGPTASLAWCVDFDQAVWNAVPRP